MSTRVKICLGVIGVILVVVACQPPRAAPRTEIPREAGGLRSGDEVELIGADEVCMWQIDARLFFPAGTHAYVVDRDDGDPKPDRLVRVQVSERYPGRLTWTGSCRRDQLKLVKVRYEDQPKPAEPREIHIRP